MSDPDDLSAKAALEARLARLDQGIAAQSKAPGDFIGGRTLDAGAARASRIGMELVVAMLAGAGLGYGLDRWLGTLPLFALLCSLLGFAAGVMNAWRAMNGKYGQVGFDQPQDK